MNPSELCAGVHGRNESKYLGAGKLVPAQYCPGKQSAQNDEFVAPVKLLNLDCGHAVDLLEPLREIKKSKKQNHKRVDAKVHTQGRIRQLDKLRLELD